MATAASDDVSETHSNPRLIAATFPGIRESHETDVVPSISFNSIQLLTAAFKSRNDARQDARRPNALTLDSLAAVVMSAASCEAFINEFAEHTPLLAASVADWAPMPKALTDCAAALARIEAERGSVVLKYLIASLVLTGEMFDPGNAPLQDFEQLVALRNSVMHLKPSDSGGNRRVAALAQRGQAYKIDPGSHMDWINRLETPETADWACRSARTMILAVLAMLPDPPAGGLDLFGEVKRVFRSDERFPS